MKEDKEIDANNEKCDANSPCALCPRKAGGTWEGIGCNRGNFQAPTFKLCRRVFGEFPKESPDDQAIEDKKSSLKAANNIKELSQDETSDHGSRPLLLDQVDSNDIQPQSVQQFYSHLNSTHLDKLSQVATTRCAPLRQCALAIISNFLACLTTSQVLNNSRSLEDLVRLMPFAIVYQAEHQDVS